MKFAFNITICLHNIILPASDLMIKAQGTMRFTYDITICIHIIIKVQGTMKFAYDITVCIYYTIIDYCGIGHDVIST